MGGCVLAGFSWNFLSALQKLPVDFHIHQSARNTSHTSVQASVVRTLKLEFPVLGTTLYLFKTYLVLTKK